MAERVIALAFLAGSGFYLALSFAFPFGSAARPGPGYFPVAVGVFLCLVAAVFTLVAFRRDAGAGGVTMAPTRRSARARAGATAVGLVGFVLLLPWTGYSLAAFGFVALLLRRLGGAGWPAALGIAVASAALSYWVFATLLSVPLPRGVLLD